jgi:hypothetical protein
LDWGPVHSKKKELRRKTLIKKGNRAMVTKTKGKATKKKGKKSRVKTLDLRREDVKDLTGGEQKKIKGGGGMSGSVLRGT